MASSRLKSDFAYLMYVKKREECAASSRRSQHVKYAMHRRYCTFAAEKAISSSLRIVMKANTFSYRPPRLLVFLLVRFPNFFLEHHIHFHFYLS